MNLSFLLTFLILSATQTKLWANPTFSDSLSPKDKKELEYLLGPEFIKKTLYYELSRDARKRSQLMTQVFLKETAHTEQIKREEFIKNNPWKKWEKMENYNALQRWLHHVSPILIEKPSTKDKP